MMQLLAITALIGVVVVSFFGGIGGLKALRDPSQPASERWSGAILFVFLSGGAAVFAGLLLFL